MDDYNRIKPKIDKLINDIKEIAIEFPNQSKKPLKNNFLANKMRNEFSDDLRAVIWEIVENDVKYTASFLPGTGNWAKTPWAGVLNDKVAKGYEKGLGMFFRFNFDLNTIELYLNQGYYNTSKKTVDKQREKLIPKLKEGFPDIYERYVKNFNFKGKNIPFKEIKIAELDSKSFYNDLNKILEIYEYLIPFYEEIIKDQPIFNLIDNIKEIANSYERESRTPLKNNPLASKMRNEFSNNLNTVVLNITKGNPLYESKFSYGMGSWVKIPWAGIKNYKVAKTFTKGLYIHFKICHEESKLDLSIAQGYSSPDENIRVKIAKKLFSKIEAIPEGFEYKHFYPIIKSYDINQLDDKEFLNDLTTLIKIYEELIPEYIKVLKEFKVRKDVTKKDDAFIDVTNRNIWRIAPGSIEIAKEAWEFFKENNLVGIGTWGLKNGASENIDYSKFNTPEEIKNEIMKYNISKSSQGPSMIWNFVHNIKIGDVVIVNMGRSEFVGIGIVTSDYIPPNKNENKNIFDLNHVRKVKWLITEKVKVRKTFFQRSTIRKLDSSKWNEILWSYGNKKEEFKNKLINYLYFSFKEEYFNTAKGINHLNEYEKEHDKIKYYYEEALRKYNKGSNSSDYVWKRLISPKKTLHQAYGDSKNFFEIQYNLSQEQLEEVALNFFTLINNILANSNDYSKVNDILNDFSSKSKGFKTGIITPTLYLLDDDFYIINRKTIDTINLFSPLSKNIVKIDNSLENYVENNFKLHKALVELSQYVPDLEDFKNFDMFCHWLCSSSLGNFARDKPLPLIGFQDKAVETPKDETVESLDITPEIIETNLKLPEDLLFKISGILNAGKHVILQGAPGCGKTELAIDISESAVDKNFIDGYILTTATSDWTTFDTIGGLMPDKDGKLYFAEGKFLEAIRNNKWLIIDEINRSDIDKAFGQLFTVLSGQGVELPYKAKNGESIKIQSTDSNSSYYQEETATYFVGKNWKILATMNIYDKDSLFEMSYAFMRRFAFIKLDLPNDSDFEDLIDIWADQLDLYYRDNLKYLLTLNSYREIGPAIFKDMIDYIKSRERIQKSDNLIEEAILSYIIPQFDGLSPLEIENIIDLLKDKELASENIIATLKY